MENYKLGKEEVVLFRGRAHFLSGQDKLAVELLLTNLNFVFTTSEKKFFKERTVNEVVSVKDVKVYRDNYQIIQKKNLVEIYFTETEKFVEFESAKIAKEFTDVALRLVSGFSKFVRGLKKAEKAVVETGEAFNVDVKEAVKDAVAVAGNVAIEMSENTKSEKVKFLGSVARNIKEVVAVKKQRKELETKEKLQLTDGKEKTE